MITLTVGARHRPVLRLTMGERHRPVHSLVVGVRHRPVLRLTMGERHRPVHSLMVGARHRPVLRLMVGERHRPVLSLTMNVRQWLIPRLASKRIAPVLRMEKGSQSSPSSRSPLSRHSAPAQSLPPVWLSMLRARLKTPGQWKSFAPDLPPARPRPFGPRRPSSPHGHPPPQATATNGQ